MASASARAGTGRSHRRSDAGGEGGRSAETGELAELLGNEKEVRERERRVFTQQDPEDLGLSEKLLRDDEQHLRIGPAALQTSRWAAR